MGATRKNACRKFRQGDIVEGVPILQVGPDGKTMIAVTRIAKILPIDKKTAAMMRSLDPFTRSGKFCALSGKTKYIYVDFTKKLNPTVEPYGIGRSFHEVRHFKLVKKRGVTRKTNRRSLA